MFLGGVLLAALPARVAGNGATQREIEGRVESVDTSAGRFVVGREFRGRMLRVTLTTTPSSRVFTCSDERPGLDQVRPGMSVSAFYEVVGADGIVNTIVIEPAR
jgi:hypothetical protein